MTLEELKKFVQGHFKDGLAIVVGSGLSAAEGMSGMPALAQYLIAGQPGFTAPDSERWLKITAALSAGGGLEAVLHEHAPTEAIEEWISRRTCELLLPEERKIIGEVIAGKRELRLTTFLRNVLKNSGGLPILTTNYDRLVEVACEMNGMHVDTTAVGHFAGQFDHSRSSMSSCKGILQRGRVGVLEHFPRAIVLKPHGSFDWYRNAGGGIRCALDLEAERLVITPGTNKYRAGYNAPFDKHRDLANDYLKRATRLLIVGYGFNDDHLQTHLVRRMKEGVPTLVLTRSSSESLVALLSSAAHCVCLSRPTTGDGVRVTAKGEQIEIPGTNLWDLGVLSSEALT